MPSKLKGKLRSGTTVSRNQFQMELADMMGCDFDTAKLACESFEDLIMQHIALEDVMSFSFGKIWGYTKEPKKVTGFYSVLKNLQERDGWTVAKSGTPDIEWSPEALYYTVTDPTIFYEWPETRYTTKARAYRKDRGLPEIPEYEGLSEEEITFLCEKADAQTYGVKSKYEIMVENRRKRRNEKIKLMGSEDYIKKMDRELQLKKGIKEEDLVEHTHDEVIKMLEEEWKSIQNAETGIKKKKRNYEVPEKYKRKQEELDKISDREEKLKKYLQNDSQIYMDDELVKKVEEQQLLKNKEKEKT